MSGMAAVLVRRPLAEALAVRDEAAHACLESGEISWTGGRARRRRVVTGKDVSPSARRMSCEQWARSNLLGDVHPYPRNAVVVKGTRRGQRARMPQIFAFVVHGMSLNRRDVVARGRALSARRAPAQAWTSHPRVAVGASRNGDVVVAERLAGGGQSGAPDGRIALAVGDDRQVRRGGGGVGEEGRGQVEVEVEATW